MNIGFVPVGHWTLQNNTIKYSLTSHHTTTNVLYSFISNGDVKYIGKTIMKLYKRMNGYQNPGLTQSTNIRVNAIIKSFLNQSKPVDIFILTDNGLLKYGDFRINLAAGLEDTLIYYISPEWNFAGKKLIPQDSNSERAELTKEPVANFTVKSALITLDISLGQAYYNQGFFNIKQEFSNLFGSDNSTIEIQLGKNSDNIINGYINRTANSNGTPRIMGGKELGDWIKNNFKLNDILKVDVISPISIRLQESKKV